MLCPKCDEPTEMLLVSSRLAEGFCRNYIVDSYRCPRCGLRRVHQEKSPI